MAGTPRRLGKGLNELFDGVKSVKTDEKGAPEIGRVALEAIRPNPDQPRKRIDEEALRELSESIRHQGVVQPILLRPIPQSGTVRYEIVAGERRYRASLLVGLTDIPAFIREMSDKESLAIALVENLQREDLNPLEEAQAMSRLISDWNLTQEELAGRIGKSRSAITNALRLLHLPEDVRSGLGNAEITAGHARAMLGLSETGAISELYARVVDYGLSVRQTEEQAAHFKEHGALPMMEEPACKPKSQPRKAKSLGRDPVVKRIGAALSEGLNLKVRLSGTLETGKISIAYAGREDLEGLLKRLGLSLEVADKSDHAAEKNAPTVPTAPDADNTPGDGGLED